MNLEKEKKSLEPPKKLHSLNEDALNKDGEVLDRIEKNAVCEENKWLNPSRSGYRHSKTSRNKCNEVRRHLEGEFHAFSESSENKRSLNKDVKTLPEASGAKGKSLKTIDNTSEAYLVESVTSRSSRSQHQLYSCTQNRGEWNKVVIKKVEDKKHSSSKSSKKELVAKTLPGANGTKGKDFKSVGGIGESSRVSTVNPSGIHPDCSYHCKTSENQYNQTVSKKSERKRRSSCKSPRKHSLSKDIKVLPPTRGCKKEANKIKPDYKETSSDVESNVDELSPRAANYSARLLKDQILTDSGSSSNVESNVDELSTKAANHPATLTKDQIVTDPGSSFLSSFGGTNTKKQTYQFHYWNFSHEKGKDLSDSGSKNISDKKASETRTTSPAPQPNGLNLAESESRCIQAFSEKEKREKDGSEEGARAQSSSKNVFQKYRDMYIAREEIEKKKLLATSKESARAQSSSKSVNSSTQGQFDKTKATEKRKAENEDSKLLPTKIKPRTPKTDDAANADTKEPTYEGSNENIADQSNFVVTAENKVGSKRLSDPSNALKENRPFK